MKEMRFLFGGDIITEINKKSLVHPEIYLDFLQHLEVRDKVNMTIYRENQTREMILEVKDRPILPWDLPSSDCHMAIE